VAIKYDHLTAFTPKTLKQTMENWSAHAGDEAFSLELGPMFGWIGERLKSKMQAETAYYGLFEGADPFAVAVVEVITTPKTKGPMIKMLKVIISPQFWDTVTYRKEVLLVFSGAITGCINLSVKRGSKVLKLYGRNNELLSVMIELHTELSKHPIAGLSASIQGRWLVLEG
jgi:hypothetical protein